MGCEPSVTLHHGNTSTRLTETAGDTTENITRAERVVVEGCGECFMLYESRDKEGKSYFANTGEHSLTLEEVAVMERVPCGEKESMESKSILATIILTVLVILLIVLPVSIASILFFCVFE